MNEAMTKLKESLAESEAHAKKAAGTMCIWSETGPVGINVIRALVAALEAQAAEIERLKAGK